MVAFLATCLRPFYTGQWLGKVMAITDYETAHKLYSLWLFIFYKIIYFQSYMSFKMSVKETEDSNSYAGYPKYG